MDQHEPAAPAAHEAPPAPDQPAADAQPASADPAEAGRIAALQAERAKRQELEAKLAEITAAEAERQRKALEKRGEWKAILDKERAERAAEQAERDRLAREVVLAKNRINDKGTRYAHFMWDQMPAAERGDFAEFVQAQIKPDGDLFPYIEGAEPVPAGNFRGKGGSSPAIPDDCAAEAAAHGKDPRWWFENVWNLPHRRKARGET